MGEDNAFTFECVWHAEQIYFCKEILYFYNQLNAGSMVHSYDPDRFENNQYLTSYMQSRIGGIDPVLDEQINAFKAYWLIMAVFHEVKNGKKLHASALHLREKIAKTQVLRGIHFKGLPIMARFFLVLLSLRMYHITMLASKVVQQLRERR